MQPHDIHLTVYGVLGATPGSSEPGVLFYIESKTNA